ncbi:TrkA family potassium uptake protein [soil metagenome]|jgi:trk system potassium uptake protein TrkA|nr:TrkA family potassium uptake protein [Euzebyaceae bacterium]
MHVIIGGCGRVGAELGERLSEEGHDVVLIDVDESALRAVSGTFNGELLAGDVTDRDVMVRARIANAGALAAVTQSDNVNLMAVQIASELFGVPRTVARLFNPQRERSYRKMGVRYVSETSMIAAAVRNELEPGTFAQHVSSPDTDVEVVEIPVERAGHGVTIAELEHDGDIRVATVRRGIRARIPKLDDYLQEGDIVVAAIRRGAHRHIRRLVCGTGS